VLICLTPTLTSQWDEAQPLAEFLCNNTIIIVFILLWVALLSSSSLVIIHGPFQWCYPTHQ
ncbi:hypothetical protein NDU88_004883, partial [Pleurodeles waltl]